MKSVLGLDLGTSSIGWALVNEAENSEEKSSIIKLGVRVNPLTVDEIQNFEKGKSITTNADRTLKRSMRRNLQRYKLRREELIRVLKESGFISEESILSENGNKTTFETYHLRAKAVTEPISLEQLSRVLLMINKKRGYKSSRKAKSQEDGQLIDGMETAKLLYDENLTPGELSLQLINLGKKKTPDFYRSDLQNEFEKIWNFQHQFYSDILTESLKEELKGKNKNQTWAICEKPFNIAGIKRETKGFELKKETLIWRVKAINERIDLELLAIVLQDINSQIYNSSGYLGGISDRSKELYFKNQTVGQYLVEKLDKDPKVSLKNQVFYRQDYLDEFNIIWENQLKFHNELTEELKKEIRDIIIFYQRRLKSQKGLISFCEFESRQIEMVVDGKKKLKTIGQRVIPRSSPLFQEFKLWQILNNIEVFIKGNTKKTRKQSGSQEKSEDSLKLDDRRRLYLEEKEILASELSIRKEMSKTDVLKLLFKNPEELDLNYKSIEGNLTLAKLFEAYLKIIELTGHSINLKKSAPDIIYAISEIFRSLNINNDILHFNSEKQLDVQPMFKLWHLLYSFEGDASKTGNEKLINKISDIYGFDKEYATILANISFQEDYGSLSAKAIRKILPYLKEGNTYDIACSYAGYRHSKSSLTKEEIGNKQLKNKLEILPKNSLRNPVVEKILNQMVNVVNTIIDDYGKPDEIRIELARELKKSAKERQELTQMITKATVEHETIREKLQREFAVSHVNRNDIIRYKLYEELKNNGYKTLYSNTYIPQEKLFSKDFDIEHIIPQSRLFDDSFSNKTLESRAVNIEKGNMTAYDYVSGKTDSNDLDNYLDRIENLFKTGKISKTKYNKLKMTDADIPEGFIERDLRDTQYIAKKAKDMLESLVRRVVSTTGSITDQLREDWQLINVMQELNWEKYKQLGMTESFEDKDGRRIYRIKNWSKRNDHRHHAMDALTVAFTKDVYIQYFNNVNARYDRNSNAYAIEQKYFQDRKVLPPMPLELFRAEAKKHLDNTLISIKAKNKVVTNNINITRKQTGFNKYKQQTPRGQLHLETVYGSQKKCVVKEEKIDGKFNEEKIGTVTKPEYREALLNRLIQYDNDPKKAFTGKNCISKNPIYIIDKAGIKHALTEKVKTVTFETIYTIRKQIGPDLKIDKVVDPKVKILLEERLKAFNGDPKKAFSNLEENPIWLNKEKGIVVKRVTILGVSNAEALHNKKDKDNNLVLDKNGKPQPVDYVNTGNNHHVAIYVDGNGNLQDYIVSFFEAVVRKNLNLSIINKDYRCEEGWRFIFSMKQNEYFVFPNEESGFYPKEIDLMDPNNYCIISPNLFRVQKISRLSYGNTIVREYVFRHHLDTTVQEDRLLKNICYKNIKSLAPLKEVIKVRLNHIGQIVSVGEY